MSFNYLHFIIPGIITSLFNSLIYILFIGVSGGDIAAGLTYIFFQLILTVGVGIFTFNRSIREKRDLLFGLLLSYGITGLFLQLLY